MIPTLHEVRQLSDNDLLILLERVTQAWMDRDNDPDELCETLDDAIDVLTDDTDDE